MPRRPDELVPGLGKKVVRVQPGVQLIDLAKWLDARGYECSFAPGPLALSSTDCTRFRTGFEYCGGAASAASRQVRVVWQTHA